MTTQQAGAVKTRPLDILGINEDEERVYRFLLEQPGASVAEVSKSLSLPRNKVEPLLDAIEAKGLATHSRQQPRRYAPVSPDIALHVLMHRRQEELQRAEDVIRELQERAAVRRQSEWDGMVELIEGRVAMRQAFVQVGRDAQNEVLSLTRQPILVSRLDITAAEDLGQQIASRDKVLKNRSVVDTECLEFPLDKKRIREDMETGEQVRVIPRLPFKMALADRRLAVIFLGMRKEGSALLIRSPALLDALYALFEFIWRRATPVSLAHIENLKIMDPEGRISEEAQGLLSLLATGMNDKSIIYELGLSRSTYSRRLSELMEMLNAGSRFQLGWLAQEYMSQTPRNK